MGAQLAVSDHKSYQIWENLITYIWILHTNFHVSTPRYIHAKFLIHLIDNFPSKDDEKQDQHFCYSNSSQPVDVMK